MNQLGTYDALQEMSRTGWKWEINTRVSPARLTAFKPDGSHGHAEFVVRHHDPAEGIQRLLELTQAIDGLAFDQGELVREYLFPDGVTP